MREGHRIAAVRMLDGVVEVGDCLGIFFGSGWSIGYSVEFPEGGQL